MQPGYRLIACAPTFRDGLLLMRSLRTAISCYHDSVARFIRNRFESIRFAATERPWTPSPIRLSRPTNASPPALDRLLAAESISGRNMMELRSNLSETGHRCREGRDWFGDFLIRGRYDVADGKCYWNQNASRKHTSTTRGSTKAKASGAWWEILSWQAPLRHAGSTLAKGMGGSSDDHLGSNWILPVAEGNCSKSMSKLHARNIVAPGALRRKCFQQRPSDTG